MVKKRLLLGLLIYIYAMKLCDGDVVMKFTKNKIRSINIVNETFTKKITDDNVIAIVL